MLAYTRSPCDSIGVVVGPMFACGWHKSSSDCADARAWKFSLVGELGHKNMYVYICMCMLGHGVTENLL